MSNQNLFIALRQFAKEKIDASEVEDLDRDIYNIKVKEPKGESIVEIELRDGTVFDLIGLGDDDEWFYNAVKSGNLETYDNYSVNQDFQEGYGAWYYFDEENQQLIQKIAKLLINGPIDFGSDNEKKEFAERLSQFFEREYDSIISAFGQAKNEEISTVAEETIENELKEIQEKYHIKIIDQTRVQISVANLIWYFIRYNAFTSSIKELFQKMFEQEETGIGGWADSQYEFQNEQYFDNHYFNREANWSLEKVYDKLTSEFDEEEIRQFFDLIDRIEKKFIVHTKYQLPKSKKYIFSVDGFNMKGNKIIVTIYKIETQQKRKVELSEENFYKLLYQPDLFELEF